MEGEREESTWLGLELDRVYQQRSLVVVVFVDLQVFLERQLHGCTGSVDAASCVSASSENE